MSSPNKQNFGPHTHSPSPIKQNFGPHTHSPAAPPPSALPRWSVGTDRRSQITLGCCQRVGRSGPAHLRGLLLGGLLADRQPQDPRDLPRLLAAPPEPDGDDHMHLRASSTAPVAKAVPFLAGLPSDGGPDFRRGDWREGLHAGRRDRAPAATVALPEHQRRGDVVTGESWLAAAIPIENPYCSCELTRVR